LVCGGFMAVDDLRDEGQVLVLYVTHALVVPDSTSLYEKTPVMSGCFTRNWYWVWGVAVRSFVMTPDPDSWWCFSGG
jgi:hypothetical protein